MLLGNSVGKSTLGWAHIQLNYSFIFLVNLVFSIIVNIEFVVSIIIRISLRVLPFPPLPVGFENAILISELYPKLVVISGV